MKLTSLEGKLAVLLTLLLAGGALGGAAAAHWLGSIGTAVSLVILAGIVPVLWLTRYTLKPIRHLLRALSGAVTSYREGDFSLSLPVDRRDELGEIAALHNDLAQALREQRQEVAQRELLLDSVMQNSPVALLLIDSGHFVAYSNIAARVLLNNGSRLDGVVFGALLERCPQSLRQVLATGSDGLFPVMINEVEESYHVAQQKFLLQGRPHRLILLKRLTRELSRQEVAVWKKLIRVLSHELNNSLAPISSLAHTGAEMLRRGNHAQLHAVFETIGERARHLHAFIRGYASFARLPSPRAEAVEWRTFIEGLGLQWKLSSQCDWPSCPGWFDPSQITQVLVNLAKNALESGGAAAEVELLMETSHDVVHITVRDRGTGMSDAVLANALLPFYSTKRTGTGLGLPLAREIVEAHGGTLALSNREGGGLCVRISLPQQGSRSGLRSDVG
jgi:two-component system nitrogen regulation sensor histidine kinase NtrY